MTSVRSESCSTCPYRRDVPSGLWAASMYDLLPRYDRPTWQQPTNGFACHSSPDHYCHGWAVVGTTKVPHDRDLLALRLRSIDGEMPVERAPLFDSHTEAAEHGRRDIDQPSDSARQAIGRLTRKYPRRFTPS